MIKKVSIQARAEIESALEIKVHLFLFVKVRGSWTEKPENYFQALM